MRIILTLLAVIGICMLQASMALAHPPSDILLQFDKRTNILTVTMPHQVRDNKMHYINEVKVWLGNDQIISQKFSSQTDNSKQIAQYLIIDAKPGSVIKVSATCNRGGTLEKSLTVK